MKNLTFARGLSAFFAIALAINVVGGSAGAAFESLDSITADDLNAIVNDTAAAQDTANTAVSDAAAAQSTADAALPAASLAASETDPTVPESIKDGIDWSELTGIPADFADGVDNNDAKLTEAEVDAYTANNGYLTTETDPTVNAAAKADLSTCAAGDVLLLGSLGWECSSNVSGAGKWSDGATSGDIVYTGGDVGIGTSSPDEELTVDGDIKLRGYGKLHFSNTSDQTYINSPASDTMAFYNTGEEVMRINADGNVGIGTSSPDAKLEVHAGSDILANVVDGALLNINQAYPGGGTAADYKDASITLGVNVSHGKISAGGSFSDNNPGHLSLFTRNATSRELEEAMRIDHNGNVGIGTTSPESELHVEGDIIANFVSGKNILPFQYASWEIANDGDRIEAVGQWNTSATISTDYSFDGTRSIKQVTTHVNDSGNTDGYVYYSLGRPNYNIPIKPSTKYILSAYAKASSEEAINVQLYASIDDIYQSHYPGYQSVTDEWVRISNVFTTQASADALMIRTDIDSLASDGSATVYFDAFMLEEAAPGQTEPSAWTPSMASHGIGVSSTGQLAINTVNPDSLLHIKSSPRQNSINRVCPAGTLWASFFDGDTGYDWNADDILDGRDYGVLAGIDTNDYLEDNECVVFGTSTGNAAGATPAAGEFWIDTDRDRKVDAGEIITGVTTTLNGDAVVAASPNKCEDGYVWLNQRVDAGDEPVAGECIAPIVDANNTPTISRVDFINGVCPAGTNARDNNGDGNIDDDECHVPALSVGHGGAKIGENYESLTTLPPINGLLVEGNVGVGTSSPNAHLEIDSKGGVPSETFSTTASNASLSLASSDGNTGIGTGTRLLGGIGGSEYAWFQAQNSNSATGNNAKNISLNPVGGKVGIGTTEPDDKLEVAGQIKHAGQYTVKGSFTVEIDETNHTEQEHTEIIDLHALVGATAGVYRVVVTTNDVGDGVAVKSALVHVFSQGNIRPFVSDETGMNYAVGNQTVEIQPYGGINSSGGHSGHGGKFQIYSTVDGHSETNASRDAIITWSATRIGH